MGDRPNDAGGCYSLRKRPRAVQAESSLQSTLARLEKALDEGGSIVVFSGSGLSASSGMSTFVTKGGLYDRAKKKFRLADGKTLFTYHFFDKNRAAAQAFFADIWQEAQRAHPAPGHRALASLARAGRLLRHYTLNIDGLAAAAGMDTWHPEANPAGTTVEMHGSIHQLVCPRCHAVSALTPGLAAAMRRGEVPSCALCALWTRDEEGSWGAQESVRDPWPEKEGKEAQGCAGGASTTTTGTSTTTSTSASSCSLEAQQLRSRIMLYEDGEGECVTPDEVLELLAADAAQAAAVLWVGISFQQSASTAYFRAVRHAVAAAGRSADCLQLVVNPSEEAGWNLRTASHNVGDVLLLEALADGGVVLQRLAERCRRSPGGSLTPDLSVAPGQERRREQALLSNACATGLADTEEESGEGEAGAGEEEAEAREKGPAADEELRFNLRPSFAVGASPAAPAKAALAVAKARLLAAQEAAAARGEPGEAASSLLTVLETGLTAPKEELDVGRRAPLAARGHERA